MDQEEIIDGLKTICYCKGVPKKIFRKHYDAGVRSVVGLKLATGAGSGNCRGKRCTPRIIAFLEEMNGTRN